MSFSSSRAYMPTHNQRAVLDLVRTKGPISRADLVRLSGLTFPSVSRIVGELIERGLVAEKRQRRGGMGKPPTELEVNPRSAFSVGLNLDRDHLSAVLVDLSGEVLARHHVALDDPGPKAVIPLMVSTTERLLGEQDVPKRLLLGIGVGLPVPLCADKVTANLSGDLSEWEDVSMTSALAQQFGCPVLLENNATAAAIGERWYGVGRNLKDFFLVFFAYGVGGGVILGGQPYPGHKGFGGEFGLFPAQAQDGQARDTGFYASPGNLLQQLEKSGQSASVADLEKLYAAGNETVAAWLGSAADALAPALVCAEYLLDPEAIIFGGRLPANLMDALIAKVGERLPAYRHEVKPYGPQLLRGGTGEDAAALGAAAIPIYRAMTPDPTPDGTYRSAVLQEAY